MTINPLAGQPATTQPAVNIPQLITAYYSTSPDPSSSEQKVAFGTSGHRGNPFKGSFNEQHILAITQAICLYRRQAGIKGPLFIGMDTHALSFPAFASAMEVLAANEIEVLHAPEGEYTPTPSLSVAILTYNRTHPAKADGIIITPSHNPPDEGGFKYNPPHGGPADQEITSWIEAKANAFLEQNLNGVKRISLSDALKASTTHVYPFMTAYVEALPKVVDLDLIKRSRLKFAVDPLGGAGLAYWELISDKYQLDLDVVNKEIDPTFRFMTLDWDGKVRMDPSSPYAMSRLIGLKDKYPLAVSCDTDHDRHGVVSKSKGLLPPNHYLSAAIAYLFPNRSGWTKQAGVGKTIVSSSMIDLVAAKLGRKLYEVPVGFKWFVNGLYEGTMAIGCEESAGASFLRMDGSVWSTDKDGIILALLAAEMTARSGRDPGELYETLTKEFGTPYYDRIDAPATSAQKKILKNITPEQISIDRLAGEPIQAILTKAPSNQQPIGGIKVIAKSGWFAARPSGTEEIYKIYAESFQGKEQLQQILQQAQQVVDHAFQQTEMTVKM